MANESTVEQLIQRAKEVRKNQSAWYDHYDDLARVMIPRLLGFTETYVTGESRMDEIFDGTPMRAARGLAHSIGALMRPEGEKWFFIRAGEDVDQRDREARTWLEDAETRLRDAFDNPRARMRQACGEVDLGLVVFGTAPLFVGEARGLNRLSFRALALRDTCMDWDEEGLLALYRFRKLNYRQAEAAFGADALGEKARELREQEKHDVRLTYIHAVLPREDRMVRGKFARNLPIASYWIEEDSEHIVEEGGYHEWPYIIPRLDTSPDEDMGRSPGMVALPDANTLQAMGETVLVAGQRAADPPLFAPNDGSFAEANTFPGGISYYDVTLARAMRGNPVFPLDTGHSLPITREMQTDTREQVFAAFFRNVMNLPIDGPEMTATEVIERREEWMREVGPMFGRLESEFIAPMVERAFMVMLRGGGFAQIPESLAGRNVKFEFESPVKRVRQQIEATAARMWKDEVLSLAAADPSALDKLDMDAYIEFTAEAGKVPLRLVRPQDEVEALREARAAQQQAAAEMQMVEQGAGAFKDVAKGMMEGAAPAAPTGSGGPA